MLVVRTNHGPAPPLVVAEGNTRGTSLRAPAISFYFYLRIFLGLWMDLAEYTI